jgi:hypothetical protein
MLMEELKAVQQSHRKAIQQLRKRQHLKINVEKVLTAIQNGTTDAITGNDMAELIKAI